MAGAPPATGGPPAAGGSTPCGLRLPCGAAGRPARSPRARRQPRWVAERRVRSSSSLEHAAHTVGHGLRRLDGTVLLQGVEQRDGHLVAGLQHVRVGHDPPPVLHRAGARERAVADEGDRLLHPLDVEDVEGVLQSSRHRVVVLGGDEDVPVERGDLLGPRGGGGVLVLAVGRTGNRGLAQQREVELGQVHQLVGHIIRLRALLVSGHLVHEPGSDLLAVAAGTGAADDHANAHGFSSEESRGGLRAHDTHRWVTRHLSVREHAQGGCSPRKSSRRSTTRPSPERPNPHRSGRESGPIHPVQPPPDRTPETPRGRAQPHGFAPATPHHLGWRQDGTHPPARGR